MHICCRLEKVHCKTASHLLLSSVKILPQMLLNIITFIFQLKLPQAEIVPGGLIALLTRGSLKQPTEDTLEKVIRLNGYFDELHGRGTSTKETKNTLIKTNKFLARRCPDIDERLVKAFAKVKYTKKIKDKYEEILMKRRLAAKLKGKKLKSNRDHLKDGQLRCQSKLPEIEVNTEYFYDTMFGSEVNVTEMGGTSAEEVETINMQPSEVVEVAVGAEVAVEEAEVGVEGKPAKKGRGRRKVEHEPDNEEPASKRRKIHHRSATVKVPAVETKTKGRRGKKLAPKEKVKEVSHDTPKVAEVRHDVSDVRHDIPEVVEVPQDIPEVRHDAAEVAEVRHNAGEEAARGEDCETTGARRAEEEVVVVAAATVE